MATEYRVLGALSSVSAKTLTDLYTVPSGKQAVISSLIIGSRSAGVSGVNYGICIRQGGAAQTAAQYIVMNNTFISSTAPGYVSGSRTGTSYLTIGAPLALVCGITLSATDVISVSAESIDITFHCFGSQIVPS